MNVKEAAEYLGISIKTLERKIAGGEIAVAYVPGATGKQRTFDRSELDRFKDAQAAEAAATTYVARPRVAPVSSDATSPSQALQRGANPQTIEASDRRLPTPYGARRFTSGTGGATTSNEGYNWLVFLNVK